MYIEVRKGMYGLPQASLLAQKLLKKCLNKHCYTQSAVTAGVWTHGWRPICFSLVVDDFSVKYIGQEHADHLIAAFKDTYDIEVDTEGDKYVGISLDWVYVMGEVHLSMPGSIKREGGSSSSSIIKIVHSPSPSSSSHGSSRST